MGQQVKITADTDVLVRAVLQDDEQQAQIASQLLRQASLIAIPLPSLCELVWVLKRGAGLTDAEITLTVADLLQAGNVAMDRPAVEAGLAHLRAGGDFADGVIAYRGSWLGGETFVSFDKQAARLATEHGYAAQLLA